MVDLGLQQRVVLITNATSPVGQAAARLFAAEGAWVAVQFFSDAHGAKKLVDSIRSEGGRALLTPGSVRDHEGAWRIIEHIEMEWQQIDVLVHVAPPLSTDEAVPLPLELINEAEARMTAQRWGRIVILSEIDVALPRSLHVRSNNIKVSENCDIEATAMMALFLGSDWNRCLSGQSFPLTEAWNS